MVPTVFLRVKNPQGTFLKCRKMFAARLLEPFATVLAVPPYSTTVALNELIHLAWPRLVQPLQKLHPGILATFATKVLKASLRRQRWLFGVDFGAIR